MKSVSRQLLGVLAVFGTLFVLALPWMVGGLGYAAPGHHAPRWNAGTHYSHAASIRISGGSLASMGAGTLVSGLLQLGLLIVVVLGSLWLVRAVTQQEPKGS